MILAAHIPPTSIHQAESLLFGVLLQLVVIILFARAAGQVACWLGQTRVVGEIIGGLLLGPSLFGRFCPELYNDLFHSTDGLVMNVLSQIGLILLMFHIGCEFDFIHLREKRNRKAVFWIAAIGIVLPFILGLIIGHLSAPYLAPNANPLGYKLFMATALSITAVPVLGRIMMEFDLTRTRLGTITIAAAAFTDVVGWISLAVVSAMAVSEFDVSKTSLQIGWIVLYAAGCIFVVRPLLRALLKKFKSDKTELSYNLMALIFGIIFLSGMLTYKLGIFAIFGGFMMGTLLFDEKEFVTAWNKTVSPFVMVFFMPIFFTYTGLKTDIHGLDSIEQWSWCAGILGVATIGKFAGCFFAATLARFNAVEASCIGIMMNTKGLMELIVLNVGYDLGIIPQNVFTMLVIMAVACTIMTSPFLRSGLPKLGHAIPRKREA